MEPLFRHVIAIVTDPRGDAVLADLAVGLKSWDRALDMPQVGAWIRRSASSALGHRRLGPHGCVLGRDMAPSALRIEDLLTQSWGAYVAVAVAPSGKAVKLLRDPTGRVECWHFSRPGAVIYFSHYEDVRHLQAQPWEIDWNYLCHHLNQDYLHGETTGLIGVSEVLPGQLITHEGDSRRAALAWRLEQFATRPHDDVGSARRAIRLAGEVATEAWASRYERIVLDLSGGLDSSIMLGLLRGHVGHPNVVASNRTSPGEDGDEQAYARAAAERHGVVVHPQIPVARDEGFSTRLPRLLMRPRGRMLPMGYDELGMAFAEAHPVDAFFTGTGGDHVFFDYLPAAAIHDYAYYDGRLSGYLEEALNLARVSKGTVWSVLAELRRRPGRGRSLDRLPPLFNGFLSPTGRAATDFDRYLHPSAAAAVAELPPAKALQVLNILELQRHYYRFGRADMVEEIHPFISQPMLEACLRTPSHWFAAGGLQRGLARQAFADLLPDLVRLRRSKGGNTTYWLRFFQDRLPAMRNLLLEGRIAQRGLLDREIMSRALTPMGLAAGRDFMAINICLTAELWVRAVEAAREDPQGRPADPAASGAR